ncbi:MAG: tetratricopeptide repeat protein [Bryobacteraceae bacterium]
MDRRCRYLARFWLASMWTGFDPALVRPALSQPGPAPAVSAASCREKYAAALPPGRSIVSEATGLAELGGYAAQHHDLDCAITAYRVALAAAPRLTEVRYQLALSLYSKGEAQSAAVELHRIVVEEPKSAKAWNALGVVLQNLKEPNEAIEAFQNAVRLNPQYGEASFNLAQALLLQSRYSASIGYVRRALEFKPPTPVRDRLLRVLASAYAGDNRFAEACEVLRQVIEANPDSAADHFSLGSCLAHQAFFERAAEEYKEAARLEPGNDQALLEWGKALIQANRFESAVPLLGEYVRRVPENFEGQYMLGRAYKNLGKWSEAAPPLRKAVELNPANYEPRYFLGFVMARSGDLAGAIRQLNEAKKLKPDAAEVRYELALALKQQGENEKAKPEFTFVRQAKERGGQLSIAGRAGLEGNQLLDGGQAEAAADAYRRALELDPSNGAVQYNLAVALARAGHRTEAMRELKKALGLDPKFAMAHNQYGVMLAGEDKFDDAEHEFRTALTINPQYAEAKSNLAVVRAQRGDATGAIALLREAVEDNPGMAQPHVNLGLLLARQSQFAEAARELQKAMQISPGLSEARAALDVVKAELDRVQLNQKPSPH